MSGIGGAEKLHNVFVYGSLMADDVVRALLNRVPLSSLAFLNSLSVSLFLLSLLFIYHNNNNFDQNTTEQLYPFYGFIDVQIIRPFYLFTLPS